MNKQKVYIRRNKKDLLIKLVKKGKVSHEKICLFCETPFISNRKTSKFCSDLCRVKFYQKKIKLLNDSKEIKEWIELLEKNKIE